MVTTDRLTLGLSPTSARVSKSIWRHSKALSSFLYADQAIDGPPLDRPLQRLVAFRVRADSGGKKRVLRLAGSELIARFLQHVLPSGFRRIRHYGLLSPARKKVGLAAARSALAVPPPEPAIIESVTAFLHRVARLASMCCPHCGGQFRVTATLLPQRGATARGPP